MTTPARKHYQRAMAAKAAGAAGATTMSGDAYELAAASLWEDRRRLKQIKSVQKKIQAKAAMLPQYESYITGVLEAGKGAQDDVLMTLMVWRLDVGDISGGLDIAEYALRHGLKTPDHYQRDTASIVAEQTAEEILSALPQLPEDGVDVAEVAGAMLGQAERAYALVAGRDMHDQIKAKLYKAMGYARRETGDLAGARDDLTQALELHDRIGVKKDIERLERELAK